MNITEIYGLPFVSMSVVFRGRELKLEKVLLDTGSASTLLNADIDKKYLGQIFERFYKADKSRTRTGGGSGLGLSISQKIIEMHQGRIEVWSQPGEGTVMTVRIPLCQT